MCTEKKNAEMQISCQQSAHEEKTVGNYSTSHAEEFSSLSKRVNETRSLPARKETSF
jgi:hypothetical protein